MVKVTIEHDDSVETIESEVAFIIGVSDNNDGSVNVKCSAVGDLPQDNPGGFLQGAGDGARGIVRAIGSAGVKDAELNFLIGFAGNTPDKTSKDLLYTRLRKFFRGKGEETSK